MSQLRFLFLLFCVLMFAIVGCSSSISDPKVSTGLLGDDYFGETILPDEEDLAPPGLSLLNFKGGEFVRSGSDQEIRWILKPEKQTDYGLFASRIEYSDDLGTSWKQIPGAYRIPALSGNVVSYTWRIPEISGGDKFLIRVTINNSSQEERSTQSDSPFTLDNDPPVVKVGSLVVNGGQPIKKSYFSYSVGYTDATSPIGFICAKNLNRNSQESIVPDEFDACWKKVSEFNLVSARNLDLQNITHVIGFLPGDYVFRIWAKDQAGNISALRSGLGEAGIDKIDFTYSPAKAIQFQKMSFSNSNNPQSPPTASEQDFTSGGTTAYVQYKTDETPSSVEISLSSDGGETYGAPVTTTTCAPASGFDFCRRFSYSSTSNFQIRIKAISALGMISTAVSPPLNSGKFRLIAGNLDAGIGGSATSAGYRAITESSFVIDTKSRVYINDSRRGILLVSPDNGSVSVYLAKDTAKSSSGDGGPVAQATTQNVYSIAIDYQDRLLIVEKDRIRRVDFQGTIDTIIGGASATDPGSMNFFPIQGCMRPTNSDLVNMPAYGSYPSFAANPTEYLQSNFILESAFYVVSDNGSLLLRNIDRQNHENQLDPNYKIKKENIFYANEFKKLRMNFAASNECAFNRRPTITPLPNGDIFFEGFHSREIAIGRGSYIKQANRAAGPTWYAYYSAPTATKGAELRLIPFKGAGSLNYKVSGDTSKGLGTPYLNQTFENAVPLTNSQITFNYQTNKILNVHTRAGIHYNSLFSDFYLSINFIAKSGSAVGAGIQFVPEGWGHTSVRLITSRRGELYSANKNISGLYKYMPATNKFERILGTGGAAGQCEDGTRALECAVDIQDAFIDENDNIYFFDRDRLRVLVKKTASYKDSIVTTLFGFSKSQGDYDPNQPLLGDSLSARFNSIRTVNLHSFDSKLMIHDQGESLVREFSLDPSDPLKFKMNRIAGNSYVTTAPTYNGSMVSNELAKDVVLRYNTGVFTDPSGNVYARGGTRVFSRLNRTGANQGRWEVILGNPSSTPTKKIYEFNANACDSGVITPGACDINDRSYEIHGIVPVETGNPFLLISTWAWYQYDRQGGMKLARTIADGTQLVRNLTMTAWTAALQFRYPADGSAVGGTSSFPRYAPKTQYLDVNGTGYLISYPNESWLNETRIRYLSLNRNASGNVTSAGKVGTLLSVGSMIRSYYFLYNPSQNPSFVGYVCLATGQLRKFTFNNSMTSHMTAGDPTSVNVTNTLVNLPTGYQCAGQSIEYSSSEGKIYFPVSYDGVMGVGEVKL